jgi:hypothetical protein
VSEFPCYTFEILASYTRTKLEILYNEALRQRASKSFFIAQQINVVHMDKEGQKKNSRNLDSLLYPYGKVKTDNDGWAELRRRRR